MSLHANTDLRDGLSQTERFPRALHPAYFKPDERDSGQLLNFTIALAGQFNYYNIHNRPDGTWEEFFDLDMDVLFTLIARIDLKSSLRDYDLLQEALLQADTPEELVQALNEQLDYFFTALDILVKTRVKSTHARNNTQVSPVATITADCYNLSAKFIEYYSQIKVMLPNVKTLNVAALLPGEMHFPLVETENLLAYPTQQKAAAGIYKVFGLLFSELRQKYSQLIAAARYYLQHQDKDRQYDPHLGLFMAFLELYGDLQQQMNRITQRHLDFYYQQILGMERRRAVPDQVHIICEPGKQVSQYILPAGEQLLAEPVAGQPLIYQTDSDAFIGRAVIKELKTGFISRQVQFEAGSNYNCRPVEEVKVYKGNYPVPDAAGYSKGTAIVSPWPLMGEEQSGFSQNQRTMEDASPGFVLGSPLLYVRDGFRNIQLKFYIPRPSFLYFTDYVQNFSVITGNSEAYTTYQLLNRAFYISITGDEGWIGVEKYSFRLNNTDEANPYLDLTFKLSSTDVPVGLYQPLIHGDNYAVSTPAVKIEINNNAFHNAFGYLRNMEITRISIVVDVEGARGLQLQNNLGPVSIDTPFQAFGPVPATGSYLDIKNTNIFNRFTRSFDINIEWFDLPSMAGGFETYFQGYQNHTRNESFTANITPVENGKSLTPLPAQTGKRLFQTRRDENSSELFLCRETVLENLEGPGFSFGNRPLLDKEEEQSGFFREGAVRLELTGPADAFGHRLYPVLFPAAIMHNAKRFVKKVPIPEQPYIPVIKSVEVDYRLEHSEVLYGKGRKQDESFITLIHLYPFGQVKVYPDLDADDITFVPYLDRERNLLIGLQSVNPGQPLSFLFQLQEMKYHHTAHSVEDVEWSYLKNNRWEPLKPADVLSDSTHNFIESGMVVLQMPAEIPIGNTLLGGDCFWLKASVNRSQSAGAKVLGLFAHVVAATRLQADEAGPVKRNTWLPAASVKGFVQKIPEINQVWQLFASTGGRQEETKQQYYLRVSERLRHKMRPRTSMDISQMILDAFPDILMVKCIGAGTEKQLVLPIINMQVVVIPREREDGMFISRQPGVSLDMLYRIKQYISGSLSPFAAVEVGNPVYEKIKIVCTIAIRKDGVNANDGYYLKMLNEDVSRFINPWLYNQGQEIKIGSKIYIQDILDDIKRKPYVQYITAFSVLHFFKRLDRTTGRFDSVVVDSALNPALKYIEASRADAVLIAADSQLVTVVGAAGYQEPRASGIGDFIAGDELSVYVSIAAEEKPPPPPEEEEDFIDIHLA